MAIALIGASTYLGVAVAECLRNERGYETIPAETVADAARASQGVIDCHTPDGERDPALVAGLIEALAGTGRPFVYSSTAWVMGNTRGRLAGESFPLRPPPGLEWLPAVERLLFDTTVRGLRGVVIRPAVAYGRVGGLLAQLAEGTLPLIGDGGNLWSFIHVDDLAELYVLAFESAPAGSLYIAADGPSVTFKDLACACGARRRATPEEARAELGTVAGLLLLDQRAGSTRAGRELGWQPSRPAVLAFLAQSIPA